MSKKVYMVRHCEATGQANEAELTEKGIKQAEELAAFFQALEIDRIISSPFQRAIQSVMPLAQSRGLQIELDDRLTERVLSSENLVDWQSKLEETFTELDLKFAGGESSREAMGRILTVIEEVFQSDVANTVIVTHGNLMSLFFHHIDKSFGFDEWSALSNPDVFLIREGMAEITRLWK